ncbi:MAG: hypothetical protein ACP5UL_06650, partial [Thermoplasmata archaeon]
NEEAVNIGTAPAQDVSVNIWGISNVYPSNYPNPQNPYIDQNQSGEGYFTYSDSYSDIAPLGRTTFTFNVNQLVPQWTCSVEGIVYINMVITYYTYNSNGVLQQYTISQYPEIIGMDYGC